MSHRRFGGSILTTATVLALQLALVAPANAVAGALDTTFGGDGKVTTRFIAGPAGAEGVAIQANGKIVAAGSAGQKFALARYNRDGTLDSTFGGDGKVTTR